MLKMEPKGNGSSSHLLLNYFSTINILLSERKSFFCLIFLLNARIYDNWEKLVEAVLRREKDRQLALCESFSSSSSADLSSRFSSFSFDPFLGDVDVDAGIVRSPFFSGSRLDEEVTRLEGAVTFLLEYVQKLLVEQANLILGVEKELKALQNMLGQFKAFLTANKQEKGEVFLQLARQIREAVYEAEDTLDAFLTQRQMVRAAQGQRVRASRPQESGLGQGGEGTAAAAATHVPPAKNQLERAAHARCFRC